MNLTPLEWYNLIKASLLIALALLMLRRWYNPDDRRDSVHWMLQTVIWFAYSIVVGLLNERGGAVIGAFSYLCMFLMAFIDSSYWFQRHVSLLQILGALGMLIGLAIWFDGPGMALSAYYVLEGLYDLRQKRRFRRSS